MSGQKIPERLRIPGIFKNRRDYTFLLLLVSIFAMLVCAFLPGWIQFNSSTSELPFSLHSVKEADYSIDHIMHRIPAIGLDIIEDVMRDNNVSEAEIAIRVGTLASSLLTPVPMSTGTISVPNTPVPATPINPLPTFSSTGSPAPTALVTTPNPTAILPPPIKPTSIPPTPPIINPPAPTEAPDEPVPAIALSSRVSTYVDNDSSGTITFNDALQYQFTVTNTGDTSLNSVRITDNSFGMTITCPTTILTPSTSMTCTANSLHTVTLAEANAGSVTLLSTALSAYAGKSYTKSATLVTPVSQNPDIQLVKSLASYDDHDSSSSITAADGLWYQFAITNSGNVSLTNISVTDITFTIPVTCPVTSLSPTVSTICTADTAHIITGAESSAGQVSNTATGSGKFNNSTYTDSNTLITVVVPVPLGTISGQVRDDSDGDGDLLDPDPGIAGVTVYLTDSTNTVTLDTTTTDPGGTFTFNNLLAGDYLVHETDPAGYTSTADSNGANDNQVPVTLASGETRSDIAFLDNATTPSCTAPDPVNGFVASTNPANGAINVPMSTTTISIVYNQPMMDTGGQSVDRVDKYAFNNQTSNKKVDIVGITYNPATYIATLTIDTSDSDWQAGSLYELTIKTVQNACGTSQTSITRTFTTE